MSPLKGRDEVQDDMEMSMVSLNEMCNEKYIIKKRIDIVNTSYYLKSQWMNTSS